MGRGATRREGIYIENKENIAFFINLHRFGP
jgi:hypothetical protein